MTRSGPITPSAGPGVRLDVTPASAGWRNVGFRVVDVTHAAAFDGGESERETVIVPLSGAGTVTTGSTSYPVHRTSVFEQVAGIVYLPPGEPYRITTDSSGALQVAIGTAPASGVLPARHFTPDEIKVEIRGGGTAYRQVVHTLAPPLPAERLIVYEVYVPRGTWAGWPPHRHDGVDGSPYLEETYYFRLDRPEGYVLHRNFSDGADHDPDGHDFDEVAVARDGEVVLVPKGFHTSVVSPGSNMYFLNVLAGDLVLDERATPPCFHADHTWITEDWMAGAWTLPVVSA